jgi:RNA polymerase sigma factor (TIGR02999 family)
VFVAELPQFLNSIDVGDPHAAGKLLPLVYDELRQLAAARMAAERPDHTLDATALVHEAYLRLGGDASFASKSQFFRAAAVAMQRILVDHARKKRAEKRGGAAQRFELSEGDRVIVPDPDTLLAIDEAVAHLAAEDSSAADLARLRLFAGQSIEEAAETLAISRATAFREWAYAQAFLTAALSCTENSRNS